MTPDVSVGSAEAGLLRSGVPVRLSYLRGGGGRPILLLHGFASNAAIDWRESGWVGDLVSHGYEVLAPDQRGHGGSVRSQDPGDFRIDSFSDDAFALAQEIWGKRKFEVVGYSMGSHVAMTMALRDPDRIASLVLGGMGDGIAETVGLGPDFADALDGSRPGLPNHCIRFRDHAASIATNDLAVLAACLRGQAGSFDLDGLAAFHEPALVVVGHNDRLAGTPHGLASRFPRGTAIVSPDANHATALSDFAFRRCVVSHLDGISGGTATSVGASAEIDGNSSR